MARFAPVLATVVALLVAVSAGRQPVNNRPVIGILSQPSPDDLPGNHANYLAASYVKFIEAAGARVVPIPWDAPEYVLDGLFDGLNGILIPGGAADLRTGEGDDGRGLFWNAIEEDWTPFFRAAKHLYLRTLEANTYGDYFPLWGTCLGMEIVALCAAEDIDLLQHYDAGNYTAPLVLTDDAEQHSAIYASRESGGVGEFVVEQLSSSDALFHNHEWGIAPSAFEDHHSLHKMFAVTSVNDDKQGETYVSTFEGRNFPIYGVQFHPEKPIFEWWDHENMPHYEASVEGNAAIAQFIVREARKSDYKLEPEDEAKWLIYNWAPEYSHPYFPYFEQTYFFDKYHE